MPLAFENCKNFLAPLRIGGVFKNFLHQLLTRIHDFLRTYFQGLQLFDQIIFFFDLIKFNAKIEINFFFIF